MLHNSNNLKRARSQNVQTGLARVYEQLLSENASSLDQEELRLRRNIFLLLVGACRPFTLEEISVLLALRCPSGFLDEKELLLDPEREVLRLCWPLTMIVDGSVQLIHMSVKEFLTETPAELGAARKAADLFSPHLTLRESNAFLARKCLAKLCQDQYKAPGSIASLLRRNLKVTSISPEDAGPDYEAVCYNYACLHWEVHLTAVKNPAKGLLAEVGRFLTGYEFITWSEVRFRLDNEDLNAAINVRPNLESWLSFLPPNARGIISLSQYFDLPYTSLASFYNEEGGDRVLPLLCQARLGDYWSLTGAGDFNKGHRLLEIVAEGFRDLLGERNPLSLKAECNLLIQYSWMNRWQEAYEGLSRIAQIQQEVVGENIPDYYISLEYAAWANFSLTNLNDSVQGQARATAGLYQTTGPTDKEYLRSQMFQCWAQERRGLLDQAFYLYEDAWKIWTTMTDSENPMAQMLQKSIASIYWKKGELKRAETLMRENFVARQRLFTMNSVVTIDSGFQLAVVLRESGRLEESQALLDFMSGQNTLEKEFERFCQFEHLRALLELGREDYNAAHDRLRSLLHRAITRGRDANNRELLWIRLTLADMLRKHNRFDEAAALFNDIVKPATGDSDSNQCLAEEPSTPQQLATAEKALRHVRRASSMEADTLLCENKLEWVRT